MDLQSLFAIVIAFLVALSVHESAHALMAYLLGDPTAKLAGRLSLNPIRHLDPLGTLLIFVVHFGWGKPVPVNPHNLRSPLRDQALISLAGPASNFITAMLLVAILKYFLLNLDSPLGDFLKLTFYLTISLNLALMVFNLIPIPPLDGSKVLFLFLGQRFAHISAWLEKNGPAVLFMLIIFSGSFGYPILQKLISNVVDFFLTLLYL